MALVRLTYFSRKRIDKLAEPGGGVADLLAASVANNRRDGVTGGLIHDRKWFAQVLEGEERAVSMTFERILQDPRHSDIRLVKMQPISSRRFGAWTMAAAAIDQDSESLIRQYSESERFDPPSMDADRLGELIAAAVRDAPPQPRTPVSAPSAA
jgi:hypothetical protein